MASAPHSAALTALSEATQCRRRVALLADETTDFFPFSEILFALLCSSPVCSAIHIVTLLLLPMFPKHPVHYK